MVAKISSSITELIGNTPLLRLSRYAQQQEIQAEVIAKLELFNPNHSVKDRIALSMIEAAERNGTIQPGDTLVETTSGNTGIGLAAIAAAKGYKFRVYINDFVSIERTQLIQAYGAEVVPFSTIEGFREFYEASNGDFVAATKWLAEKVTAAEPEVHFLLQLENPANPAVHVQTTGPEIWRDSGGKLDIFIAAVGTGGTLSGTGRYLKQQYPSLQVIAVEPGVGSQPSELRPEPLEITGVHAFSNQPPERIPANLDHRVYDEVIAVETWQAYAAARQLALSEGVLVGDSSGAVLWAAEQVAARPENHGKRIVVLLADGGSSYLSTQLFAHQVPAETFKLANAIQTSQKIA
ncbi:pyridoxal-phosphate dependent enzyme [Erwinia sp. S63]|jgi:cysteine synthase|uniref:PLP-dependent cysteine synthase family protein n=1 Tax=Erwinia sp. S63 TaxID=2769341 RepID=UPI00190B983C|nr:pyridoxal-phosphate dependent enzyme [Erwinia sp. S63]MBK0095976.1 pyridoxal-phosphate dependent enzyme [Erwinia sp. S63]